MKYNLAQNNKTYPQIAKSLVGPNECMVYLDRFLGKVYMDIIWAHDMRDDNWFIFNKYEIKSTPFYDENNFQPVIGGFITTPIFTQKYKNSTIYSSTSFYISMEDLPILPDELFMFVMMNLHLVI